jgi:maltooligosyltrehalose trehalohydrolase
MLPDPASRFQPDGPEGPSQVIDPVEFNWTDQEWKGITARGQVLYEMHVGTFTKEGTWSAAIDQLEALAETGLTAVEIMPVADFPGRFGWGYDGVNLYAPTRLYGQPDDFRRFVNTAHELGLGVILDVVYNHIGTGGSYLQEFSQDYLSIRYKSEWGDSFNFDGPDSEHVRDYIVSNVAYWIREFHVDGYRFDATQQIFDNSSVHILAQLSKAAREAALPRQIFIIGENEPQKVLLMLPLDKGGYGIDALFNDDFHHTARVALTGRADAYCSDYLGSPQEFISALKRGYLFQGQWYSWQKQPRGTPALDLAPEKFIHYIQSHDQVANSGDGKRCHLVTSPGRYRAITAILLLTPQTPMLFQGQEFAASSPFFFFADHEGETAHLLTSGRLRFMCQFRALATPEMQARLPDPVDPATFHLCKLDHSERITHEKEYRLHYDLLKIRHHDEVFSNHRYGGLDGAVLGINTFVIRFFGGEKGNDRLLMVNLGRDVDLKPAPEPLLAPPEGKIWSLLWSSEDPRYGGLSTPQWPAEGSWYVQGEAAVVLRPRPIE